MRGEMERRIAQNTAFLYLRMVFTMAIGFYTSRVLLQSIGIEDFGIYNLVGGVIAMLAFVSNTFISSQTRFLAFNIVGESSTTLKNTFSECWTAGLIVAFILLIICESLGLWWMKNKISIPADKEGIALWVFHLSVANMFVSTLGTSFSALIVAHERMNIYAGISVLNTICSLLIILLLQHSPWVMNLVVLYTFLLLLVNIGIQSFYVFHSKKQFAEVNFNIKFGSGFKSLMTYSSWDLYGNFSVVGRTSGIAILQNLFFGVTINAAIGIANQVQGIVNQFASNILFASKPQVIKYYAAREIDQMLDLMIKTTKYSTLMLCMVAVPLLVDIDSALHLWLGVVPIYSGSLVKWFLLFVIAANFSQGILMGIHATSKIKKSSVINGTVYLLVLPISYIYFKNGSSPILPYILNFVLVLVGGLLNALYFKVEVPQFNIIEYYSKAILPPICLSLLVYIVLMVLKDYFQSPFLGFIVVIGISAVLMSSMSWVFIIEREIKDRIINKIKSLWSLN